MTINRSARGLTTRKVEGKRKAGKIVGGGVRVGTSSSTVPTKTRRAQDEVNSAAQKGQKSDVEKQAHKNNVGKHRNKRPVRSK